MIEWGGRRPSPRPLRATSYRDHIYLLGHLPFTTRDPPRHKSFRFLSLPFSADEFQVLLLYYFYEYYYYKTIRIPHTYIQHLTYKTRISPLSPFYKTASPRQIFISTLPFSADNSQIRIWGCKCCSSRNIYHR